MAILFRAGGKLITWITLKGAAAIAAGSRTALVGASNQKDIKFFKRSFQEDFRSRSRGHFGSTAAKPARRIRIGSRSRY